jgi:hypothetical protein
MSSALHGAARPSGRAAGVLTSIFRAAAMPGTRSLRIALLSEGQIVEERLIPPGNEVTIGESVKSTFVVPSTTGLTREPLFVSRAGRLSLRLLPGMAGRIVLGDEVHTLDAIREVLHGGETKDLFLLPENARGTLRIGTVTLLFQLVLQPASPGKPRLPSSVLEPRHGLDGPTTILAALSFLLHFGTVGTLYSDWGDRVVDGDASLSKLVDALTTLPAPPVIEDPTATPTSENVTTPQPPVRTTSGPVRDRGGRTSPSNATTNARLLADLERMNISAITAFDPSHPSTGRVLESGNVPVEGLDAVARSAQGVQRGTGGDLRLGGGGAVDTRERTLGDLGGTAAAVGPAGKQQDIAIAAPGARAQAERPKTTGNVPGAEGVIAAARGRARACYIAGLDQSPDMEGAVSFSLRIGADGSVAGVSVSPGGDITPGVVRCVENVLRAVRFTEPEGSAASVNGSFKFVNSGKKRGP